MCRYAFLMESTMAEYELGQLPCDLQDTGIRLGMRSYGFAIHRNAIHQNDVFNLEALDQATLKLIHRGDVEMLEDKSVVCLLEYF